MRPSVAFGACVSALVLAAVQPLPCAAEDKVVRLAAGESISAAVATNLRKVSAKSDDPTIARVRLGGDRLTITGANAGKTRVTVTGERVRYLVGFNAAPGRVSPRRARGPAVAEYYDVTEHVTVIVAGGRRGLADAVTPGPNPQSQALRTISAHDYLVVRVGKSISAGFPTQTSGARARSADRGVATAAVRDERVTITGMRPGRTTVTVTGEYVRHLAGFSVPPRQSVPLNGNKRFEQIFVVDVVPVASEPTEAETRRVREAPPPEDSLVYELCINGRRSLTLPPGIGEVETIVPGNVVKVEPVTSGSQRLLRLTPLNRGVALVRIREKFETQRINQAPYDESFHVRVVPEDLSGEWIGAGGFSVEHAPDGAVTASFNDGRVFRGTLNGRALQLVFTYTDPGQMPSNWPDEVRRFMMNKTIELDAQIQDPDAPGGVGDSHMIGTVRFNHVARVGGKIVATPRTQAISYRRRDAHTGTRAEAGLQ